MHSLENDNELDNVARKAADAFNAGGSPDWSSMQALLDKEMPQEKRKKRFIWWMIPVVILAGIGVYWITEKQVSPTISISKKTTITPAPSSTESKEQTKTIAPNTVPVEASVPATATKNNATNNKASYPSATPTNNSTAKAYSPSAANTSNVTNASNVTNTSNGSNDITINAVKDSSKSINLADDHSASSTASTSTNPTGSTSSAISTDPNNSTSSTNPTSSNELNAAKKKTANNYSGIFVALTAGADMSTVHYNYQNGVGYNIGAMFGYRINKNWSVQTGAIYTQKNYKMNGTDFHPPKGSYLNFYKLDMVSGSCYMWDIPIMATYHFNGTGKKNAFLSLGSSSYFMKKENYNYYYTMNNIPYNRPASYDSDEKHLFSIIHISGGIEKTIGKNLTGIIEPYAKLPLAGVGFGSIDLSSFGINFALQYRQLKTK